MPLALPEVSPMMVALVPVSMTFSLPVVEMSYANDEVAVVEVAVKYEATT